MHGDLWLSLFRSPRGGPGNNRPAGLYGVAFVCYLPPSPLTYHELLVGRLHESKRVTITDIWVDSESSRAGGRELWAIGKELADFTFSANRHRLTEATTMRAWVDGGRVAAARFRDLSRWAPKVPFAGGVWQDRQQLAEHRALGATAGPVEVTADLTGRARILPAVARWSFAEEGPLGWLRPATAIASARMADFELSFD